MSRELLVCVSGGFDPIHSGHINLLRKAKDAAAWHYGQKCEAGGREEEDCNFRLIVLLNSDEWLERKKGKVFMGFEERATVLSAIRWVDLVTNVWDKDGTVCEGLRQIQPQYFCNGGDRGEENTPELDICKRIGIVNIFNVGGDKTQSSSDLLREYANAP